MSTIHTARHDSESPGYSSSLFSLYRWSHTADVIFLNTFVFIYSIDGWNSRGQHLHADRKLHHCGGQHILRGFPRGQTYLCCHGERHDNQGTATRRHRRFKWPSLCGCFSDFGLLGRYAQCYCLKLITVYILHSPLQKNIKTTTAKTNLKTNK